MTADIVYAICRKLIHAQQIGVLSHTVDDVAKTITFVYLDGTTDTIRFNQPSDGKDGVSVTGVEQLDATHFKLLFSNGTKSDSIEIPGGSSELEASLTATQEIGSVSPGKTYPAGTKFEQILRDMLIKEEPPVVKLALTPSTTLYDVVTEVLPTTSMKAIITPKTNAVSQVKFYVNGTVVETKNVTITPTGDIIFNFSYVPTGSVKTKTTFQVSAVDVKTKETKSSAISVDFIGKSYYGLVADNVSDPTEGMIKTLNSTLKNAKGYVYKNIVCDYNKIVYAYPKSLGALSSIKDVENNINYTDSFNRIEVTVDGIVYYVYTLKEPTGSDGVNITFA